MNRTAPTTPPPLWDLIERAAQRWPDQPMLVARQGDRATFGEYRDRVLAMAAGFADLGVGHGDNVSWILPTWVDTHLLDETVDPEATVRFLSEQGCTHAGTGTPFYLMYLAAQQRLDRPLFGDLKVCPGGGAPIPPALHRRVVDELGGVGVASGWGLTEAPVLTNGAVDDPDEKLATTEGRALPGAELVAVSSDETVCAPGAEGELRAKGPQVMLGYMDGSLDTGAFDADGYYRTGDLGIIDADGYVTVTGRLKDIIIRHGENISAKEVEDLLFGLDGIADAAVIGLPDARTGESVCAVVTPAEGAVVTLDGLAEALAAAGLRRQATPERLEIVDELPRNPAGKVLKRELQQRFGPSNT